MKYEASYDLRDPLFILVFCMHIIIVALMTLVRKNIVVETFFIFINLFIVLTSRRIHILLSMWQPQMLQKGIISGAYLDNGFIFVRHFIQ